MNQPNADSHSFVMGLLKQHKACNLGGDELHRPPMVALGEM